MDISQAENIMTGLGFSAYESRAYIALTGSHPLTGYELAKRSGIPRSKIYECIERLERKGMVVQVSGSPQRYVPLPPDEAFSRMTREFESSVSSLTSILATQGDQEYVEYVYNLSGYEDIIGKADDMIANARDSIDISIWDEEAVRLNPALTSAAKRGVSVRHIAFGTGVGAAGDIYLHRAIEPDAETGRWITVIRDRDEVLTGSCAANNGDVAAWTRNRSLLYIGIKYIEHEIIRISEYGEQHAAR